MKRICHFVPFAILLLAIASCEHYLDVKSDKSLTTPSTADDLQAILSMIAMMNTTNPGLGEIGGDDIFIPSAAWNSISNIEHRMPYIWNKTPVSDLYWNMPYMRILSVNTVIDQADKVTFKSGEVKNNVLGQAHFFRGLSFFKLAEVFSVPYDPTTAQQDLGVVLRLRSDVNVKLQRSNLEETYQQIIKDMQKAAGLLPSGAAQYPTRPTKAAAYGALARCYLAMRNYGQAGAYADSCLQLKSTLLDYNTIPQKPYPFDRFNEEVIFYSTLSGFSCLSENVARVDTVLYESYSDEDLRRSLFFTEKPDGYFSFTGNYGQSAGIDKFDGITTAEMLLVRAECAARAGNAERAVDDLVKLLRNRMSSNYIGSMDWLDQPEKLLHRILEERRKELVFRGLRWSDLRRLSFEKSFDVSLRRTIEASSYEMSGESLKSFAFYLPQNAIENGGIEQNR